MNQDWKKDPRVKNLDPKKLDMLTNLASQLDKTPKNQWMSRLLSLNMEASQKGLSFSDQETDLIVSILTANMPASELQKINTLKMLSKKLSSK